MNKLLAELYRKNEWKEFRLRILELDNYRCTKCGTSYKNNPSRLNVHHKLYYPDTKPWEYEIEDVTTYCRACHLEEHDLVNDYKFGWVYIGFEDLGDLIGECEFTNCGRKIRYQHTLFHPKVGEINVGAGHADYLLDNHEASELEITEKRKKNFCKKFKQTSLDQYEASLINYKIVINRIEDKYFTLVGSYRFDDPFDSLEGAQVFCFDIINRGMIENLIIEQHDELFKKFIAFDIWSILDSKDKLCSCYLGHHFDLVRCYTINRSYNDYPYSYKEKRIEHYNIFIDNFLFESVNTLQEAQIYLFDMLYDNAKYYKIFKKKKKDFQNRVTDYREWKHSKHDKQHTYMAGNYTFLIKGKPQCLMTLYVMQEDYRLMLDKLSLDTEQADDYYVKLNNYNGFPNAAEAVFNYMMNQKELLSIVQNDPLIRYSNINNWQSCNSDNGLIEYSYILNGVLIRIKEQPNKQYIMSIGQIDGTKEFSMFTEAQKIAYQFITSGQYEEKIKKMS